MDVRLHSLACLLQSCNTRHSVHKGRQLHLLFLKKGILNSTLSIANRLLQVYMRCGHTSDAILLFDEMSQRNSFSWNTMIEGFMNSGHKQKSIEFFNLMPHKNDFSWTLVISGFAKSGELDTARRLLNDMPRTNGVAWNSMIHGYLKNGRARDAVKMFKDMDSETFGRLRGDTFVLATVIGACADLAALLCGKQIHSRIVIDGLEFDSVLGSSLVNLYGKCGDLDSANHVLNMMKEPDDFSLSALVSGYAKCGRMNDARRIFDRKSDPCVVLWNSMISGYVSNNEDREALVLFLKMRQNGVQEDSSTFTSVLSACSALGVLEHGKQIHSHACKFGVIDDVVVASSLLDTYSKCGIPNDACKLFSELKVFDTILLNTMITIYSSCGRIEEAKQIFKMMPNKSLISWNSMIVGLSQNGCPIEALNLFCEMNKLNLRMDKFSLASVVSAAASISSLELGELVFARVTIIGLESDQIISTFPC
ncbi:hypothetical protein Patl1_08198 [Pistacia atlantica]|uniref:Uncharacterized protein n=1 Tax=Pistacia atlantica TaxID=434234 RepID=A0ACC1AJ73_9ROSI|nr:hypothetical protein Patl1_08198 [Pistacia atlantica]